MTNPKDIGFILGEIDARTKLTQETVVEIRKEQINVIKDTQQNSTNITSLKWIIGAVTTLFTSIFVGVIITLLRR